MNILDIFVKEIGKDFYEEFLQVLLARQRFQNILEPKALLYMGLLKDLLAMP